MVLSVRIHAQNNQLGLVPVALVWWVDPWPGLCRCQLGAHPWFIHNASTENYHNQLSGGLVRPDSCCLCLLLDHYLISCCGRVEVVIVVGIYSVLMHSNGTRVSSTPLAP